MEDDANNNTNNNQDSSPFKSKTKRVWTEEALALEVARRFAGMGVDNALYLGTLDLIQIPDKTFTLKKVEKLFLQNNFLKEIPREIGLLTDLRNLRLSNNQLRQLPDEFANLTRLQSLQLHRNCLWILPEAVWTFPALQLFTLKQNPLQVLQPNAIAMFRKLKAADIETDKITTPHIEISKHGKSHIISYLAKIYDAYHTFSLSLERLDVSLWPAESLKIAELTNIDLAKNRISVIPPEVFTMLSKLKKLKLSQNEIQVLPVDIANMSFLEELDISFNSISIIPWEIARKHPSTLKVFEMLPNPIQDPDPRLIRIQSQQEKWMATSPNGDLLVTPLSRLRSVGRAMEAAWGGNSAVLDMSSVKPPLEFIPLDISRQIPNIVKLDFCGQNLRSLEMASIDSLTRLEELWLRRNFLSHLDPATLAHLTRLRVLALDSNRFEHFTPGVLPFLSSSLQILTLSRNPLLKSLPEDLGECRSLQILSCSKCGSLESLPNSIGKLQSLKSLCIDGNRIQRLPDSICELTSSLTELRANRNLITEIQDELALLTALSVLSLHDNRIERVPKSMCGMTWLSHLSLHNNPLKFLPIVASQLSEGKMARFSFATETLEEPSQSLCRVGALQTMKFLKLLVEASESHEFDLFSGAGLTVMPSDVLLVEGLTSLAFTWNALEEFPIHIIGKLPCVSKINLTGNRISVLPEELIQITTLRSLNMRDNLLTEVHLWFWKFTTLQEFHFEGCPVEYPAKVIRDAGLNEIRRYLSEFQYTYEAATLGFDRIFPMHLSSAQVDEDSLIQLLMEDEKKTASSSDLARASLKLTKAFSNQISDLEHYAPGFNEKMELLDCSSRALWTVPEEIEGMISLRTLNLQNNSLTAIPQLIHNLEVLETLNIRKNLISLVAGEPFKRLGSLQCLDLGENKIQLVPNAMSLLTSLKVFQLDHNALESFPGALTAMSWLTTLDVRFNRISDLPASLENIPEVTVLLANNSFKRMSAAFLCFANLYKLEISDNDWEFPPKDIVVRGPRAFCSYISKFFSPEIVSTNAINASNFSFDVLGGSKKAGAAAIPDSAVDLRALDLTELPQEVFILSRVTSLSINSNRFQSLPEQLVSHFAECLISFHAQRNLFTSLPEPLLRMSALKSLKLQTNQISQLPDNISMLCSIRTLDVSINGLQTLPGSIGKLLTLQTLKFNRNAVHTLPASLFRLTNLRKLCFNGNQVKRMLPTMFHLRNLLKFEFEENPIEFPDAPTIALGHQVWFEQLEEVAQIYKNKLMCLPVFSNISTLNTTMATIFPTNITRVDITDNAFREIPPEFARLSFLREFFMNRNRLEHIPAFAENWGQLINLQLPENCISEINPVALTGLSSLKILNLDRNQLTEIPKDIAHLRTLQQLIVNDNRLTRLPDEVCKIASLRRLILTGNRLLSLPNAIGMLSALQLLSIAYNCITVLPVSLSKTPLKILHFMPDDFERLPEDLHYLAFVDRSHLGDIVYLKYPMPDITAQGDVAVLDYLSRLGIAIRENQLDFGHMKLTQITKEVFNLTSLTHLYLTQNELTEIPDDVMKLSFLRTLDLDVNRIEKFPFVLLTMTSLEKLLLRRNQLAQLPDTITSMQRLSHLDIRDNQLRKLPFGVCAMPKLISNVLLITGNDWTSPHPSVASRGWEFTLNYMRKIYACSSKLAGELELSSLGLRELPAEAVQFTGKKANAVQLQHNELTALPDAIELWTNAKILRAEGNGLVSIPVALAKMVSLRELYLQDNHLHSLIPALGQLYNLRTLRVENNHIKTLPASVGNLTALILLSAYNNHLTDLPEDFKYLTNLNELLLDGNQLSLLPDRIGDLRSLNILSVRANPLRRLPPELVNIPYLNQFSFTPDTLEEPSPLIVAKGTQVMFEWMRIMLKCTRGEAGKSLNLQKWGLSSLPIEVLSTRGLTSLDLSSNHFTEFPSHAEEQIFKHLRLTLKELRLDNNEITRFSERLCDIPSLTLLSMCRNRIKEIPKTISMLRELRVLSLTGNLLFELPLELESLPLLEIVEVDTGNVLSPGPIFMEKGWQSVVQYMHTISTAMITLELNLSAIGLTELPAEVVPITNLRRLDMERNQLQTLPAAFQKFSELERLNLAFNVLEELQGWVVKEMGISLQYLNLSNNHIMALPLEIGYMYNLKVLDVRENKLTAFPASVCGMFRLEELLLDCNQIQVMTIMASLSSLRVLSLSNNSLTQLPVEIAELASLEELRIVNNDIRDPPAEIVRAGLAEIKRYLLAMSRALQTLDMDLSNFNLNAFPKKVLNMTNLTRLSFKHNPLLKEWPRELLQFHQLDFLDLEGTEITCPPLEIQKLHPRNSFDYIQKFDAISSTACIELNGLGLEDVPPELLTQTILAEIQLRENKIKEINFSLASRLTLLTTLWLDSNQITAIPPHIVRMQELSFLSLSYNYITEFPPDLVRLPKLRTLRLNSNKLTVVPPYVALCTALQVLYLKGHPFQTLPIELMTMTWLRKLRIDVDQLAVVRAEDLGDILRAPPTHVILWGLDVLLEYARNLDAAKDSGELTLLAWELPSIPSDIMYIDTLTSLNLSENKIRKIRDDIVMLTCLTNLTVDNNRITFLPAVLSKLPLITISAKNNAITDLIPDLCAITSLRALNVDGNPLNSPPPPVMAMGFRAILAYLQDFYTARTSGQLRLNGYQLIEIPAVILDEMGTSLQELHLSNNLIAEISERINALSDIQNLSLDENVFSRLPREFATLRSMTKCNLSGCRLDHIPDFFGKLKSLVELNLSHNYIIWMTTAVSKLTKLEVLAIQNNRIGELPAELALAFNIRELSIAENELQVIPSLRGMSALRDIMMGDNRLTFLDQSLFTLTQLERLQAEHNNIDEIPKEISSLTCLTWLSLENNVIPTIPPEIGCLKSLKMLELSDNYIKFLPPQIAYLKNLKALEILGNPLSTHPARCILDSTFEDAMIYVNRLGRGLDEGVYDISRYRLLVFPMDSLVTEEVLLQHREKIKESVDQNLRKRQRAAAGVSKIHYLSRAPKVTAKPKLLQRLIQALIDDGKTRERAQRAEIVEPSMEAIDRQRLIEAKETLRLLERELLSKKEGFLSKLVPFKKKKATSAVAASAALAENKKVIKVKTVIREIEARLHESLMKEATSEVGPHPEPNCHCIFSRLTELNFEENRVSNLPEELYRLTTLVRLNARGNGLKKVTPVIGYLTRLEYLDLTRNQLMHLPGTMVQLVKLRELLMGSNILSSVPELMRNMTNLQTLDISGNRFIILPEQICDVTSLRVLVLSDNKLFGSLANCIGNLTNLTQLSLGFNSISRLPMELGRCSLIKKLHITDLELQFPPQAVCDKGPTVMINFLRQFELGYHTGAIDLGGLSMSKVPYEIIYWRKKSLDERMVEIAKAELTREQNRELSIWAEEALNRKVRVAQRAVERWLFVTSIAHKAVVAHRNTSQDGDSSKNSLHTLVLDQNSFNVMEPRLCLVTSLTILRMSRNIIKRLPFELDKLVSLTQLRLNDNVLTQIPDSIGKMTSLIELSLRNNLLRSVPISLGGLSFLRTVRLEGNPILSPPASTVEDGPKAVLRFLNNIYNATKPGGVVNLSGLGMKLAPAPFFQVASTIGKLDLSNNLLQELAPELRHLAKLTYLDISNNRLISVTPALWGLSRVKVLKLAKNRIMTLPPTIRFCWSLEELNLSENRLTCLPPAAQGLSALRILDLRNNLLEYMPRCIQYFRRLDKLYASDNAICNLENFLFPNKLTVLQLSRNKITGLHPKIDRMRILSELHLQGNDILELPENIGNIASLVKLNLSRNPIDKLPGSLKQRTSMKELRFSDMLCPIPATILNAMSQLQVLSLSNSKCTEIPDCIGHLTSLTFFSAAENEIEEINPNLFRCEKMKSLVLNRNQIRTIGANICRMTALGELFLGNNCLNGYPESAGLLTNMVDLRLEDNQMVSVPHTIGRYMKLKRLYLHSNRLSELPMAIINLTNLEVLTVSRNLLSCLPEPIGNLVGLKELWLADNPNLKQLPDSITKLTKLSVILKGSAKLEV